jgi:hypothetical protein
MKMTKTVGKMSVGLIVLYAVAAHAQSAASTASQQVQNFQQNMESQAPIVGLRVGTNAPETFVGENEEVGPQHILRIIPKPTIWEVDLDSRYFFTDNSTLSQRTAGNPLTSSSVFVNTVSAAYAPTPYKMGDGRFAPDIGVRSQWYNYEGATLPGGIPVSSIDFNAQTAFIGAKYLMPNNWQYFGEVDYTRIVQQPDYAIEFYHEYVPSIGIQRLIQTSQNSLVSASFVTDYHFGWVNQGVTEAQDRMDDTFNLAYSWQPTSQIVVQPYYRLTYTYYRFDSAGNNSGRNDLLNTFGFSASYFFTQWLQLQAFATYDVKNSQDNSVPGYNPGYEAFDIGLDLSATFRF